MQPSMSRSHLTLFTMLLMVYARSGDSVKVNMERRFADSSDPGALGSLLVEYPYWEQILREFIFKTISPPPPSNNILYKEILEAPLYAGPFPFPTPETLNDHDDGHETAQVLSRGDLYRLAKGGWIICQEGCVDCEICTVQKIAIVPTVKWTLRRVQRVVPFPHPKRHDLQLTVLPQADGSFHMRNLSPGSYVYVTSNNGALASFTDVLIRRNDEYSSQYPFGTTKSPTSKTPSVEIEDEVADQGKVETKDWTEGPETDNEVLQMTTSTLIPKPARKRGREVPQGGRNPEAADNQTPIFEQNNSEKNSTPLTMSHPSTTPMPKLIDHDFGRENNARIILGRDQFGEKHLVHVVPVGEIDQGINRGSMFSDSRLLHHQPANRHVLDTEHQDHSPLYRRIFRRVIDSLNTHKNAIENFLFSPKQDARFGRGQFSISPSRTFDEEEEPDLKTGGNSVMGTSSAEENSENQYTNETTDTIEEVIQHSEETSSTSGTTDVLNKEDELSGENRQGMADVTQEPNHHLLHKYFDDESNSEESFSYGLIKRQNNSETLILKEVAKSVVNHPQGFNSLADTTATLRHETDYSLPTISDGTTSGSILHSDKIDKSRRHVLYEY